MQLKLHSGVSPFNTQTQKVASKAKKYIQRWHAALRPTRCSHIHYVNENHKSGCRNCPVQYSRKY